MPINIASRDKRETLTGWITVSCQDGIHHKIATLLEGNEEIDRDKNRYILL